MEPSRPSERLATHIAYVLVGSPAWLWFYRGARRLSLQRRAAVMHRAYLYLVALFGAVMAVIAGGMLLAQGVRLAVGTVDLGTAAGLREIQAASVEWTVNALMYGALWWAHFRAARQWSV